MITTSDNSHRYTSNPADTVAAGILGGCDLDCGAYYQLHAQVETFSIAIVLLCHYRKQLTIKLSLRQTLIWC